MRGRCGSKRRRPCGGSTRAKPSGTCRVAGGQPPTASTLVTSPGSNATSFDRDGLRSGGGGDRLAAVLVVLGRRRQGPLPRTGLLRPPGRRISGGGRLPAGGAAPAARRGGI